MLLLEEATATSEKTGIDALIKEARRLRRRRWLRGSLIALVACAVGGLVHGLASSDRVVSRHQRSASGGAAKASALVQPKAPGALAVAPNGDLYLVDTGRDEVLRRLPSGAFQVIAGDGRQGFSGDGGPAIHAELRLQDRAGIAVAGNGTLYIADDGNDRVRAVLANGQIETVAGGGRLALPAKPGASVSARSADLGGVAALAVGPGGELYIGAHFIVRLASSDKLDWVAGSATRGTNFCSMPGCSVDEWGFQYATGLAFDGGGDLVVAGGYLPGAGYPLAEIRANGKRIYLASTRGAGGQPAAIASGPIGSVVVAAQGGLYRIAEGSTSMQRLAGGAAGGVMPSPLSTALTAATGIGPHRMTETFYGGDGIASGAHGQVYADAQPFIGLTFGTIVEAYPSGMARVLWKS